MEFEKRKSMKMKKIILALMFAFVVGSCAEGASIWAKRDKNTKAQYTDDVARNIGDILTITISEGSEVQNDTKRDMTKSTSRSTTFDGTIGNITDIGEFGISADSSNKLNGQVKYEADRSFIDSVTVVVVDILPNGNLVIMGSRSRKIEGDNQTIEVSGIVRPSDIGFDNIVTSEKVADFHIYVENSGISESFSKPGWLDQIINKLWPF